MSTEIATKDTAVEKVILKGDLSSLSAAERVDYYRQLCDHLDLNPVTKPFDLLTLNGKLVLYATKNAAEQLRKKNGVSIDSIDAKELKGVYVVTVKGHDAGGRTDVASGAVTIGNASGDTLANLLMKAETKAKRRLTLSICGLGMLDETEIETIPGAERVVSEAPSQEGNDTPEEYREHSAHHDEYMERAKKAAESGVLSDTQVRMFRKRCSDAIGDDADLLKVVEHMESEVNLARQNAYKNKTPAVEPPDNEPTEPPDDIY